MNHHHKLSCFITHDWVYSPNKKTCLEQPKEKVVEEEKVIPASSISTLIAGYGSSSDEEDIKKQETKELVCETIGESNIVSTETPPIDVDSKSNFKTKQCRYFLKLMIDFHYMKAIEFKKIKNLEKVGSIEERWQG